MTGQATELGEKFDRGVRFARERHAGHSRKGSPPVPDIAHLLAVASLVLEMGGSEDQAIGALLHDTVEDTGTTLEEIAEAFGDDVARYVAKSSEQKLDDSGARLSWRVRKEGYVASIAGKASDELTVTLADKIANLSLMLMSERSAAQSGPAALADYWALFNAERAEQQWYFEALLAEFDRAGERIEPAAVPWLEEFRRLVGLFAGGAGG
jgi:GTP pyrophosphokinase